MKIFYCLFLLFISCCFSEQIDGSQNYQRDEGNYDAYQKDDKYEDKEQNQDFIIRPCSVKDINCIRGFFAHYSQCLVAEGPAPDPYVLHLLPNLHVPHANLTYELVNPKIKGLNKFKIEEFYINKATDTLVMEVVFDKIVVTTPEARLKYHRKGKEPLEVVDYTVIEYDDVSFTLTIPHVKDLQLSRGHVYSYINNPHPKYTLGPATYSCKDPVFIRAVTEMESKVGLSLQEAFFTQGPIFFAAFFRSSICVYSY